jgi:hypothetical protein
MKAIKFILAGGAGLAALTVSTPAAAQYYPGYGNGGGNVIGQVLGQILNPGYGGGYGNSYGGYGMDSRMMVDRCAAAVTERVNREYRTYPAYGGYGGGYGYNNGYGAGARVVAITSVEPRSNNRMRVRGIAQASASGGYNGYPVELSFKCNIDYRGRITDIDLDRTNSRYGYAQQAPYGQQVPYTPYGNYPRY